MLIPERKGIPPLVKLSKNFKFVDQMEALGTPSLKNAKSLTVEGKVTFSDGVIIEGEVHVVNKTDSIFEVAAGTYKDQTLSPS